MKLSIITAVVSTLAASAAFAAPLGWDAFAIRNNPVINDGPTQVEFVLTAGGQKAGLGTNNLNGSTFSQIVKVSIDRLDDHTRYTEGSGQYVAPYMNFWITDGLGNYAVAANEPSNPEWTGTSEWDADWDTLKTKTVKFYESTTGYGWLPSGGVGLTFNDIASFTIQSPDATYINANFGAGTSGAPREFGTGVAYGFNWVFGDTLSNYASDNTGYLVGSPVAVTPEPASLSAIALAAGLLRRRR